MSRATQTKYYCDSCHKELSTGHNSLTISTEQGGSGAGWSRLRVKIEFHHGFHNNGSEEDAELCQECAISLLEHALSEVRRGVRATEGTESIYEGRWHS